MDILDKIAKARLYARNLRKKHNYCWYGGDTIFVLDDHGGLKDRVRVPIDERSVSDVLEKMQRSNN